MGKSARSEMGWLRLTLKDAIFDRVGIGSEDSKWKINGLRLG